MELKYEKIYRDILSKIKSGEYKVNALIPSESYLVGYYNVSRDTVRKALSRLENEAYIKKLKGKGSIVIDVQKYDFSLSKIHTFKEIGKKIKDYKTIVESMNLITPPEYIKRELCLDDSDKVWEVIRVREIYGEKIILDKDYLCSSVVENLTKEICEDSIYEYLENILNIKIAYARKEILTESVTDLDIEYLDIKDYNMIVVVKSHTYLDDTTLFHYTESRHRPDKFNFIHFARRYN